MARIFEDINIKHIVCKVVAGILIVSVTFFWTGTRKNAYAISVEGKVVAVVKDKQEAERALEKLVKQIKYEKRTDIAINETVIIEPINAKSIDIDKEQDVIKALNAEISYHLEAFEILVDGQSKVIVESKDVAMQVLEEVAKAQFQGSNIEIKMVDEKVGLVHAQSEEPAVTSQAQTTSSQSTEAQVSELQTTEQQTSEQQTTEVHTSVVGQASVVVPKYLASRTKAATQSTIETEPQVVTMPVTGAVTETLTTSHADSMQQTNGETQIGQSKQPQKEILVVKEALPKGEELTKIKVEAVEINNQSNKEDNKGDESKEESTQEKKVADESTEQEDEEEIDASEEDASKEDSEDTKEKGQKIVREFKSIDFNEEVIVKNKYVDPEDILSKQQAINILLAYNEEVVEYELVEGDNIWDIAIKYGTTMDHILEINPQIEDETRMQIGEKIKLEVPDPIISIATTEQATFKEIIPAEIEYVAVEDMYEDETEVQEQGYDGLKEITVLVHKVNGKEVSRDLLDEKILKEPKTKVFAYGTKKRKTSYGNSYGKPGKSIKPSSSIGFMHPLGWAGSFSSGYGYRWGSFHAGVDIAAPAGTPIYAAASGVVTFSGYNSGGYGNLIIIDHGNGQETYYAHNSSNYVRVGQHVSKGDNIGSVGSTGNSTGNHVHFEIRNYGSPINPYSYIY